VILTLPDGTNKMYKATPQMKFDVNGQKATVFDLKKGMRITAEKIVEEPRTEITNNTLVTGTAPKPKPVEVAAAPAPAPQPTPAAAPRAAAPPPAQVAAQTPAPTPAREPEPAPSATLPKTGSPLPLVGLLGLLFTGAGIGLRRLRRS
jgi:LPXTG-motif cell wall-anchored protein